jgi:predicted methyltransferase MtxX (methanogen marker protein 4)
MKKLMIAALMFVGMTTFAQGKVQNEKMTPQQRQEHHMKKLTTELNLNESQQKELTKILAEQNAKREANLAKRKEQKAANVKLTQDERLALKKEMLDNKIAMRQRVKKILSPEQYQKWEEMNEKKRHDFKGEMHKRKGKASKSEDNLK